MLGSIVQIGPITYTVIGVAAKGFVGLWPDKPPAAFIPITSYAGGSGFTSRSTTWWETYGWSWLSMIVQRKPGVGIAAANADLTNALRRSWDAQVVEQPTTPPVSVARPQASVGPILAERGPNASNVAKVAAWVGGVSVAVLLIACANVANLLLARALRRRREIALRLALGASRGRLLSQLLTESVVLAVFGGISGLLLAHFAGAAIRTGLLQSEAAGGLRDPRTVLFATATAITVGLLTGIVPALQAGRADLTGDLKAGVREGTHRRSRARVALLVFQGALSVVLLVGAGLFVRSLLNVNETRLGFDADRVLLVDLNMRGVTLDSAPAVALRQRLLQAARETPGVEHVSMQWAVPFWSSRNQRLFVDGIDSLSHGGQDFYMNSVSPEYFATMGTRIVRGRGIADEDGPTAPRAMVVSEGMAKALWPGKNPIGQCLRVAADTMPCTYVVGIAENIKAQSLSDDSGFYYYVSAAQFRPQSGGLFVRTRDGSTTLAESVRRRLQREMPGASYVAITPLTDILGRQTRSWHLGATMFVAFGGLALLLAAIGLYSVIAYNVEQRTHELGVRRALGAQASDMVRLVVTDGLRLAGAGVALGVVAAFLAGRWIEPLLFNVSPRDPAVFAFVAATLVAVAMAASWIPALRGSRVDPNVALRSE